MFARTTLAVALVAGAPGWAAAPRSVRRAPPAAEPARAPTVVDAVVTVDVASRGRELPPRILGSNIQYPDWGDGVLDPETLSLRADAVAAIAELAPGTIRFPGGAHSDFYHWRDGVGPQAARPEGEGAFFGEATSNAYGTDEHLALCRATGAEPSMTANFGTGTPREAANWVEYCNGVVPVDGTDGWAEDSWGGANEAPPGYFAWLRARFGHPEPYGIARWEVGNEVYNDWSDRYDAREYAARFLEYVRAMKAVDPTILVAAVGYDRAEAGWKGDPVSWNRQVARIAGQEMDALHVHTYVPLADGYSVILTDAVEIGAEANVPQTGSYTFEALCQGSGGFGPYPPPSDGEYVILEVRVDGQLRATLELVSPFPALVTQVLDLTAGAHTLSLAYVNPLWNPATSSGRVAILPVTAVLRGAGGSIDLELVDPPPVDRALMLGPSAVAAELAAIDAILREETGRDDVELWITEFNAFYGLVGLRLDQALEMKSAVAVADLAAGAITAGVDLLQQWSAIKDWYFGMIEDERGLGLRSFARTLDLLRRGTLSRLLPLQVEAPMLALEAPVGTVPAISGVPSVGAMATLSADDGRVAVFLVNRDLRSGADVEIRLDGAEGRAGGTLTRLWSVAPDTVDVTPPPGRLEFVPGRVGEALRLTAPRHVGLPVTGRIDGREGSVELWVRPAWDGDDGTDHSVLSLGWLFQIWRHRDGAMLATVVSEAVDDLDHAVGDASAWRAGEWHHVAATWREGGELRLYLDGVLADAVPLRVPWRYVEPAHGFRLGTAALNPEWAADGDVDEVRLSRSERSAQEIAASAAAGLAGRPLGADDVTALLLHLDGSLGDEVRDERTRESRRGLVAGPPRTTVYLPPCSVGVLEVLVTRGEPR